MACAPFSSCEPWNISGQLVEACFSLLLLGGECASPSLKLSKIGQHPHAYVQAESRGTKWSNVKMLSSRHRHANSQFATQPEWSRRIVSCAFWANELSKPKTAQSSFEEHDSSVHGMWILMARYDVQSKINEDKKPTKYSIISSDIQLKFKLHNRPPAQSKLWWAPSNWGLHSDSRSCVFFSSSSCVFGQCSWHVSCPASLCFCALSPSKFSMKSTRSWQDAQLANFAGQFATRYSSSFQW